MVLGNGGSGKTSLARELGARTGLPVIHLDALYWTAGWTPTPDDRWEEIVRDLAAGEEWIIDGNYSRTLGSRLARADTVIFLDLPRVLCVWRVTRRWLRYRGRSRPDMRPGVNETMRLEFLRWVAWDYPTRSRPAILRQLEALPRTTRVVRFRSRGGPARFLASVGEPAKWQATA
jgi:adenylate kinase family enzyme